MITFLYKKRSDDTYVIAHRGNPYHAIPEDELWDQCVEEYAALDEEPPDEPVPPQPVISPDPIAELRARIEALEGIS